MGLPFDSVEHYYVGGFHPIYVGDTFKDRYRVINKLGFGGYSTIWLVEDLLLKCFASLKVLSANSSANSSELSISRHLQQQQEKGDSHPGKDHVIRIFDTFVIQGPNGTHHCIVTEILGINLNEKVEDFYGNNHDHFPPDVTKKLAAQVALGVAYLHKCGIIHGDLHLRNVLFYSSKLQNASLTELNRIYGEPLIEPIKYWNNDDPVPPSIHRPTTIVHHRNRRYPVIEICLSSANVHVKICDFGESFLYSSHHQSNKPLNFNMPLLLRAPEIIFHDIVSPAPSMDIWTLGVLMYMILNKKHAPFGSNYNQEKDMIPMMVKTLGRLPDKWWTAWTERAEYFLENGVYRGTNQMVPMIGISIRDKKGFRVEEVNAFRSLIYRMFCYVPEQRIDAEEVVRLIPSEWKQSKVSSRKVPSGRKESKKRYKNKRAVDNEVGIERGGGQKWRHIVVV
ncbi:kinase-like domain-containing protein [Cyathus striatus]|nr:kinase-like domain-containing protein [Cyathus striatus]